MYLPGTLLLWISFILAVVSTLAYGRSINVENRFRTIARQAYVLMTVAVVLASGLLMYLLITHDYRLSYVWAYSDNSLPLRYLVSAFWGGQEGSFLLWVLAGAVLGLPLFALSKSYESRVMLVYNLTLVSLIILLLKQNPFRFHDGLAAGMVPLDGAGLNPLLQNPWMVIHPPVMFFGYASLAIPFAFAMAALWMRRYDEWIRVSMPWILFSVVTMGAAIMLGAYWSYETLGWGGYWGWDPVENASLIPWLIAAAMLHSAILQRTRGRFKKLNLVLAILGFLLVVYATFLTRSGVLSDFSVHSFVDLGISGWLIFNLVFFFLVSVGLLLRRWREIPSESGEEPFMSRTIFIVLGIVMLLLISVVVFFGTSAPLITRLWMEQPAQVGPDFYNRMGYWLAIALSVVLGLTPLLTWSGSKHRIIPVTLGAVGGTVVLLGVAWVSGLHQWRVLVYLAACYFALISNGWALADKIRRRSGLRIGGDLSHFGLILMVLAFMTSGWLGENTKSRLTRGEAKDVLSYNMNFLGVDRNTPDHHDAMPIDIVDPRGRSFQLRPLMWFNEKTKQLVANPGIHENLVKDLYIAPVEYTPQESAPLSGVLILTKGRPEKFRDWEIIFERFDLGGSHMKQGETRVGLEIRLRRPGMEDVLVTPWLTSTVEGLLPIEAEIPGVSGATILATGMNVDSGQIRVELKGLGGGIGRQKVLRQGESLNYRGITVRFDGFDLSDFVPESGKMEFGVLCSVEHDGQIDRVVPRYDERLGEGGITPAEIPGTGGMALSIGRVAAKDGAVQLKVFDPSLDPRPPKPASLVIDVSTKPWISLIWLGSILITIGMFFSIFQHRKDLGAAVDS